MEIRENNEQCCFLDFDVKCKFYPYDYQRIFDKDRAFSITLMFEDFEKALMQKIVNPFWTGPEFLSGTTDFEGEGQALLLKCGEMYICVLPIVCKSFKTNIKASKQKIVLQLILARILPEVIV